MSGRELSSDYQYDTLALHVVRGGAGPSNGPEGRASTTMAQAAAAGPQDWTWRSYRAVHPAVSLPSYSLSKPNELIDA